jgi:hypothetical protein
LKLSPLRGLLGQGIRERSEDVAPLGLATQPVPEALDFGEFRAEAFAQEIVPERGRPARLDALLPALGQDDVEIGRQAALLQLLPFAGIEPDEAAGRTEIQPEAVGVAGAVTRHDAVTLWTDARSERRGLSRNGGRFNGGKQIGGNGGCVIFDNLPIRAGFRAQAFAQYVMFKVRVFCTVAI